MMEVICLITLFILLLLSLLYLFSNGSVSRKFGGRVLVILAFLFVVFSLVFQPRDFIRWDLIEHFKLVDNMRFGGLDYATQESQYADLFVYNYFAYFVSILPEEYQNLLTAIPLIVDFVIVGYIYRKMFNEYLPDTNGKTRLLSILLWLFTFGIKLAISGIRCSLAVSIAVLAIFLEMIEERRKLLAILLYIVSIFIHNFALVVLIVRFATMIKKPIVVMLLSLGISSSIVPAAKYVVSNVDNAYLKFSFGRILDTAENMNFLSAVKSFDGSTLLIYMCFVAMAAYLFIVSTKSKHVYREDEFCKNVANFAATVGAVAMGMSFNYLYLERFMYLMSFVFLMIIPLHNRNKNRINVENVVIIPMSLFLFFFNDVYVFIVNYVGEYFLAM